MSEKRKDNKGRNLQIGESQRKDGKYMYRYTGLDNKRNCIYADDLNTLRKKERKIQKDLDNNINSAGRDITFLQLFDMYVSTKHGLREGTLIGYRTFRNYIVDSNFAQVKIIDINLITFNCFVNYLRDRGLKKSTIKRCLRTFKAVFNLAIQMDYIKKNPVVTNIIGNDFEESKKRVALTEQQQDNLVKMLSKRKNKYYYYLSQFILLTGLRLGEVAGLTWHDIDFENKVISIRRQMTEDRNTKCHITDTKTATSHRKIFLYTRLEYLLIELKSNEYLKNKITLDGYTDFLFLDRLYGYKSSIDSGFRTIRQQYKKRMVRKRTLYHMYCDILFVHN